MPSLAQIDSFFAFAGHQLRNLIENHPDRFPMYTRGGKWDRRRGVDQLVRGLPGRAAVAALPAHRRPVLARAEPSTTRA